jgi:hypothetical protein
MSKKQVKTIKPFLSVIILMCFLFTFAFIKMENRRMGYSFLKLAKKEKQLRNQQREKVLRLAKMTGPERLQNVVTNNLAMKKAGSGQIIQMTGSGVAIIQ